MVQLCEVAQPVGGYVDFLRVEELARTGRLSRPEQLVEFLLRALRSAIAPADGVASGVAFRAARAGQLGEIPAACAALSSEKMPRDIRLGSVLMGQHLWALSRRWEWAGPVHNQLDDLELLAEMHHAVAFGTLVSETTSSQVRAIAAYLFNTARAIVAAAVSAIPLDPTEGQRVLSRVQPEIAELAARCADRRPGDIHMDLVL